jgi:hypothetical protein
MTSHASTLEAIDPTELARVAGGLVAGDGGCIRPLPPTPFQPKPPYTPFDPEKIAFPTTA